MSDIKQSSGREEFDEQLQKSLEAKVSSTTEETKCNKRCAYCRAQCGGL
jgi:hypothetical protein